MSTYSAQLLKATDYEYNHPILVRLLIVGAAFLTYLIDRDDMVWRFVKNHGAQTRTWEHWLFLAATLLIGMGAYVCTAARLGVMYVSGQAQEGNCWLHPVSRDATGGSSSTQWDWPP